MDRYAVTVDGSEAVVDIAYALSEKRELYFRSRIEFTGSAVDLNHYTTLKRSGDYLGLNRDGGS